jgi:hypothetical protein
VGSVLTADDYLRRAKYKILYWIIIFLFNYTAPYVLPIDVLLSLLLPLEILGLTATLALAWALLDIIKACRMIHSSLRE